MDVDGLKTFLAVHRLGSFTQAAAHLHRTQPAISRRVQLLEQDLGLPLFERTSAGNGLSAAGRTLLPFAEAALSALEDGRAAVEALRRTPSGELTIALVGTLASSALAPLLRRFARDWPAVDLKLQTATSREVSEQVRRGEVSLGLRYWNDEDPTLLCEPLWQEPLVVACAPGHPDADRPVSSLKAIREARWIGFPPTPGRSEIFAQQVCGLLAAAGLEQAEILAIDSLTAQKRLVEAGFGIAVMQESAIAEERTNGSLTVIPVADLKAHVPVTLVTRRAGFLSAAAEALCAEIRLTPPHGEIREALVPAHAGAGEPAA